MLNYCSTRVVLYHLIYLSDLLVFWKIWFGCSRTPHLSWWGLSAFHTTLIGLDFPVGEYNTLQWSRLYGCCFMRKLQICFCFLISDFWPPFCFEIWSKVRCGGDIIWLFWNYFNLTAGMKKGAGLGVFLLSDKRLIAVYIGWKAWNLIFCWLQQHR